jgi:hypothetical protein
MENYLQERLHEYNLTSENAYRDKWGSVLDFLDDEKMVMAGNKLTPADIFQEQIKVTQAKKKSQSTTWMQDSIPPLGRGSNRKNQIAS